MTVNTLGRVFKGVRGKVLPVFDDGLVFEELLPSGMRDE